MPIECQVTIHIDDKVIKFATPDDLKIYVRKMQQQGAWQKFTHFPLLKIVYDPTGEEVILRNEDAFPTESLFLNNGAKLLAIGEDVEQMEVRPLSPDETISDG